MINTGKKITGRIITLFILVIIISPMLVMLQILLTNGEIVSILNLRRIILLIKSILLGLNVSIVSFIFGFFFSVYIINNKKKYIFLFSIIMFTFYLISPYIHALSWLRVLNVGGFGYFKTFMVLCLYYVPLNIIVIVIGLNSIDKEYINAGKIYKDDNVILYKIIFKMLKPHIYSIISLVFIFVMSDFSVPSLFQFKTYSLEIFTIYTSGTSVKELIILSIPLFIINSMAFIILFVNSNKMSYSTSGASLLKNISLKLNGLNKINIILSIGVLSVLSIIILSNIFQILDFKIFIDTFHENIDELLYSIKISLLSSIVAITAILIIINNLDNIYVKFIILSPLLFPGSLLGISIIATFINYKTYGELLNNDFLIIFADSIKVIPIIYFVLKGSLDTKNKNLLDCGKLYQKNTFHRLLNVELPYFLIPIIVSAYIGFSYIFGEISSSILLLPPGKQLISLKIYSYLHYGSGAKISALGLIVIIIFTLVTSASLLLINKNRRYLR